ncbi:hypothetical protein PINS_up005728 [Pythium insidiosum]|nr:hypothetical protein PINS_up005728 [Pythium insidiosum]
MAAAHRRCWIWLLVVAILACARQLGALARILDADDLDATRDLSDRVALLLPESRDPNRWCMGLLVAPDSLVTYAHCVQQNSTALAWAFFGNSLDQFLATKSPASSGNGSAAAAPRQPEQEDVGWMTPWARVKSVTVHPDFKGVRMTPSADLAVVRIDVPRVTPPFPLASKGGVNVSDWNTTRSGVFFRSLQAYQVSNFMLLTGRADKIRERGELRRVGWRYCERRRHFAVNSDFKGQVCTVASQLTERRYEVFSDTFVLLGDKLIGLSLDTVPTDSHRVLFLSEHTQFIHSTAKSQPKWVAVAPMTIGGQTAPLQGYLVGLRTSKGGENFCLGSLIAPDMVLTAAHCVKDLKFDQASVGSLFASTEEDGEQIKVRRVLIHPNFQADIFQNDFALVELEYISVQTPIALYSNRKNDYEAGTQLRFFGYDSTKKTSVRGLNSVDLRVVSPMDCMAALQPPVLDAAMLCAGGEEGKDACQGDSGGPLVLPTSSDVGLVAISSYGRGCGVKGMPAVYALASEAAAFIDKYTDGHKWKSLPLSITTPSSTSRAPSTTATRPATTPALTTTTRPPIASATNAPATTHNNNSLVDGRHESNTECAATAAAARLADFCDIAVNNAWHPVTTITIAGDASFVIGRASSQIARDTLANVLIQQTGSFETFRYVCNDSIQLYTTENTDAISALITRFDTQALRLRRPRFQRASSSEPRLPSCQLRISSITV